MKKIVSLLLVAIMAMSLLTACGGNAGENTNSTDNSTNNSTNDSTNDSTDNSNADITYKDGEYTAEQDDFDEKTGWKSTIKIVVEGGKIVSVDWNAVHKDGGEDKKTQSKNGTYAMVEKGGAQAEWHEQAEKVEQYLIEKQDPAAIKYDENGYTDAIAGVSIHVNDFVELAVKALENARE